MEEELLELEREWRANQDNVATAQVTCRLLCSLWCTAPPLYTAIVRAAHRHCTRCPPPFCVPRAAVFARAVGSFLGATLTILYGAQQVRTG
eukprot:834296-Rhodomonas_salina.1